MDRQMIDRETGRESLILSHFLTLRTTMFGARLFSVELFCAF